jgi:hypothetical protein
MAEKRILSLTPSISLWVRVSAILGLPFWGFGGMMKLPRRKWLLEIALDAGLTG